MKYYNSDTIIYHNGEFAKAVEEKIDLYSQSLHYGYSVFEGIRSYKTASGETKIFKPVEHYERLKVSAQTVNLPYNYDTNELIAATYEVLKRNGQQNAYIRPVVYAPANMSFAPNTESFLFIETWEMAPFLGEKLLRVATSSFQRPNPKAFKMHAKVAGHYVNSILASQEAKAKGFDEALLLDINDDIAEGPGSNIFFEKDGALYTPQMGYILPGITRATVFEICKKLDIPIQEGRYGMETLKQADSAFFCGTAAEVIGWESIDETVFPKAWKDSLGARIQKAYQHLIHEQ
ncbi:MAG TPA: aminotransferase class IV [Sediminibacterium sp.]|nr:aminotransferase class IV [Sediminibacterium sp.]